MSEKISKLTKEQEAMIPVYLERYRAIGLSTRPTDRNKAAAAVLKAYAYLHDAQVAKKEPVTMVRVPEIIWADSPFKGARIAAELATDNPNPTKAQISDQASKASYGSFEAYWVSFYAFIGEQLPVKKDDLLDIVKEIVEECGVYWTFEDTVVLTPKPAIINMSADGKLHCEDDKALGYPDGSGIYAFNGVRYATLTELTLAKAMKDVG